MATKSSANTQSAGAGLTNPYAYLLPQEPAEGATTKDAAKSQPEGKTSTVSPFYNPHSIRRPQSKVTTKLPKMPARHFIASSSSDAPTTTSKQQQPTLADFTSTPEEDAANVARRKEENWRRKQEKKEKAKQQKTLGRWFHQGSYKLMHPTKLRYYRTSDEDNMYWDVKAAFKDYLLKARGQAPLTTTTNSSDASPTPVHSRPTSPVPLNPMFAPPSFADQHESPPAPAVEVPQTIEEMLSYRAQLSEKRGIPIFSPPKSPSTSSAAELVANEDLDRSAASPSRTLSLSPEPIQESEAAIAEKAAHRKRIAEIKASIAATRKEDGLDKVATVPPPPSIHSAIVPPPPPPPSLTPPPPPPPQAPYNPTISAAPVHYTRPPVKQTPYNPTISAAPVHYARPSPPAVEEPPKNNLSRKRKGGVSAEEPPKQSKAAKMMAKMGWKDGEGLGKDSDGITTALSVKAGKNAGSDKIIASVTGGARVQTSDHGRFGEPSKVVVAWGCVDGVDFEADAEREDGGIRQEMGDAFNEKFGEVERIYIGTTNPPTPVYIKFNNEMSALNAVNRFFEGYEFRDRLVRAEFYNEKKFNASIYDH